MSVKEIVLWLKLARLLQDFYLFKISLANTSLTEPRSFRTGAQQEIVVTQLTKSFEATLQKPYAKLLFFVQGVTKDYFHKKSFTMAIM